MQAVGRNREVRKCRGLCFPLLPLRKYPQTHSFQMMTEGPGVTAVKSWMFFGGGFSFLTFILMEHVERLQFCLEGCRSGKTVAAIDT